MEILEVETGLLSRVMANIGGMEQAMKLGHIPTADSGGFIAANVGQLNNVCAQLDLRASAAQVERIKTAVTEKAVTNMPQLIQLVCELQSRMIDELSAQAVFCVPSSQRHYFEKLQFADVVASQFPSTIPDMEEAGKCYALGRNTACVFHLMRVTEAGLIAIARRVKFPGDRPMWEPVLNFIDAQLKTKYADMSTAFKGDVDFLAGVSAQMHAVNIAWRRRVAHIESSYDDGQAKRIFDATRGVMEHIATKLSELCPLAF